jgi:DNA-binding response OmpR family regulator
LPAERILVVDDERAGRLSLAEILRLEGYEVEAAASGEEAVARLAQAGRGFDLMLLDLKMPGMDGMAVLPEARRLAPDMQIIFLTAHGSLESAIAALRHGAQDYLLKPSPTPDILDSVRKALERRRSDHRRVELLASLESSVRELRGDPGPPPPTGEGRLAVGDIVLDVAARQVSAGGQSATLTPTELGLLALLMRQPGVVFSPAQIVREVQGFVADPREAAEIVRPIVSRLRRKLADLPGASGCLGTVKGAGYRFDRPDSTNYQLPISNL